MTDPSSIRTEHYAYCKDRDCAGCLPTDTELDASHILALWGEMLARCIAQTPETKTLEGARAALRDDRTDAGIFKPPIGEPGEMLTYPEVARRLRARALAEEAP